MRSARTGSRAKKAVEAIPVERSSGNVFEDLGVPESTAALAKADLAARIAEIIAERGLTQSGAAKLLGIDQPSVSDLICGRLRGFPSDRLFRFLNALGRDGAPARSPRSASCGAGWRASRPIRLSAQGSFGPRKGAEVAPPLP